MADRLGKTVLNWGGGWATDFGPSFPSAPQGNALTIPFLLKADNVFYELDGAPHKIGGAALLNPIAVKEFGNAVSFEGIFDYWKQGTTGTESQKRVAVVGTQYMKEDLDGTWDPIATGKESSKQPSFEVFNDHVIIATSSTVDVPVTWNQTTLANLGGSPPNFSFMVRHKNRIWAAGVAANPSRLYYSAAENDGDWTSAGNAGSMNIDPDDGDRIVGIASHKGELLVFKGPNRLSIHRITGSSPSDFSIVPFVTGVGGINHSSIFRVNDDLVYASPRGIHSLAATAAFGNYIEAFLSHPILSYYQDSLNHSVLSQVWGVNYQARGQAIWTFAASGGTTKNTYLVFDYRFQPGRWARWTNYVNANCLAIIQTSNRKHGLFAGTTTGFVEQLDQTVRSINSTIAYTAEVQTPFLNFGSSAVMKNAESVFVSLLPKGDYSMTFGYTRDTNAEDTISMSQGGGATLT